MWVELVLFAYTDDEAHIALTVRVASVELDLLSSHRSNQSVQRTAGVRLFWVLCAVLADDYFVSVPDQFDLSL